MICREPGLLYRCRGRLSALTLFLGAAVLCGCATVAPRATLESESSVHPDEDARAAEVSATLRRDVGSPLAWGLPLLTGADVERVLREWPETPLNAALRASLVRPGGQPHRLVDPAGPTSLLTVILDGAQPLIEAGIGPTDLDVAMVQVSAEACRMKAAALSEADPGARETRRAWREHVSALHELEVLGWRLAMQTATELGGVLVGQSYLRTLPEQLDRLGSAVFPALVPVDRAYDTLLDALRLTQELRALGAGVETSLPVDEGWYPTLYGTHKPRIRALRQRLMEVGYPAPPVSDESSFDTSIERQLEAFQARHTLEVTGRPNLETVAALNVPLSVRATEITEALRQIRQDPLRGTPDRLVLNLPSFVLKHFKGGQLADEHRVIVGSNDMDIDPFKGQSGHLNRTPTMTATVTQIVLNPSWSVPRRIKELVLDPLADQDPRRYDDFELSVGPEGIERAVQRPGPRNAMGRVKLVLADSPLVLHDTPGRRPFKQRLRALSHGNIRVETAEELALAMLEADGHEVTPSAAQRVLKTRRETFVTLKRPMSLSVHYATVEVTDAGTVQFHPDIYGHFAPQAKAGTAPTASLQEDSER